MLYFPTFMLRENVSTLQLVYQTIGSPSSLNNIAQVVSVDGGGLWQLTLDSVRLRTPQHIRLWRSVMTTLEGGVTPIVIRFCDTRYAPFPGTVYTQGPVSNSDNSFLSDGSGYYQPIIVAQVSGSWPQRATEIVLDFINVRAGGLLGGEYFSLDHPTVGRRLYQVIRVAGSDPMLPTVTIRPPLRESISAAAYADFDWPGFVSQLATPDTGALQMNMRRTANPSVTFIEAFSP